MLRRPNFTTANSAPILARISTLLFLLPVILFEEQDGGGKRDLHTHLYTVTNRSINMLGIQLDHGVSIDQP